MKKSMRSSNDFDNSRDIMKKSMRSSNDFDYSTDIMKKSMRSSNDFDNSTGEPNMFSLTKSEPTLQFCAIFLWV